MQNCNDADNDNDVDNSDLALKRSIGIKKRYLIDLLSYIRQASFYSIIMTISGQNNSNICYHRSIKSTGAVIKHISGVKFRVFSSC